MIVCLCAGVTERQVEAAMDAGAQSVEVIGAECGAGTGCGSCVATLQQQLEQREAATERRPSMLHPCLGASGRGV